MKLKSQWPLMAFTFLGALAAGSWVILALLVLLFSFTPARIFITGYGGVLLVGILFAGIAISFFHLGRPAHFIRALQRAGNSSISNEALISGILLVLSALYVLLGQTASLPLYVHDFLLFMVACFAVAFIVFQAIVYRIETVVTWNSSLWCYEFFCMTLLLGMSFVSAGLIDEIPVDYQLMLSALLLMTGIAYATILIKQAQIIDRSYARFSRGHLLAKKWINLALARVLLVMSGCVLVLLFVVNVASSVAILYTGVLFIFTGLLLGRYAFYRFYLNVGLSAPDFIGFKI